MHACSRAVDPSAATSTAYACSRSPFDEHGCGGGFVFNDQNSHQTGASCVLISVDCHRRARESGKRARLRLSAAFPCQVHRAVRRDRDAFSLRLADALSDQHAPLRSNCPRTGPPHDEMRSPAANASNGVPGSQVSVFATGLAITNRSAGARLTFLQRSSSFRARGRWHPLVLARACHHSRVHRGLGAVSARTRQTGVAAPAAGDVA